MMLIKIQYEFFLKNKNLNFKIFHGLVHVEFIQPDKVHSLTTLTKRTISTNDRKHKDLCNLLSEISLAGLKFALCLCIIKLFSLFLFTCRAPSEGGPPLVGRRA